MTANSWMNRNPFLSMVLTAFLTALCSYAILAAGWSRDDEKERKAAIDKKADVTYVDEQNKRQDTFISGKADRSVVESMDRKLDLILQRLK